MTSMTDKSPKRLVVIPSDPIRAYEKKGLEGLGLYYNPKGLFDEVFALSPFEDRDCLTHGMTVRCVSRRNFRSALTEIDPHVVRAYGGHWPAEVACENRIPGVPVLVSVHDPTPTALHSVVRYADLVLCMSRAVEEAVRQVGTDESRIRRLPNRVNRSVFLPVDDAKRLAAVSERFPPGRHVLHVGRKAPQKNIETLIKGLVCLPDDYSVVFIGMGDAGPYRSLADSCGVGRRCYWIESVKNSELPLWYSWCDCMCTPSRWEGFGLVFVEAAACGAAIVTSDIAPMNEYLTHGQSGHLVKEYEDPEALARAIRDVCENDDYRRRLSAGAIRAVEIFDRCSVDDREEAIYREALESTPRVLSFSERVGLARCTAGRQAARARNLSAKLSKMAEKLPPAPRWRNSFKTRDENTPAARALKWIQDNHLPTGGIRVESGHPHAYPGVTGYTVPTLLEYGERDLAVELVNWLLCIQRADGGFSDPVQGEKHVFDTGQVLRGLLAARELVPRAADAARRAAAYLCSRMIDGGAGGFPPCHAGSDRPETVHLYVLPALVEAAELFDDALCRSAAKRCRDFYARHSDLLQMGTLTHFLAYEIEALIDLRLEEPVRPVLDRLQNEQKPDGSIRGKSKAGWVCIPGLAQLAICWYKLDQPEPADKALAWLDAHQRPNGGFRGSLGLGANYKQNVEVSWAAKFYLDAHLLRTGAFLSRHSEKVSQPVSADDAVGRLVLSSVDDGNRVLQADYGKGRLLEPIQAVRRDVECVAPVLTPRSTSRPAADASTGLGSIQSLPFESGLFDVVLSAEAVGYAVNPRRAVLELVRVARPGGRLIIIDRPGRRAGGGRPTWLQPPDVKWLARILRHGCDQVAVETLRHGGGSASDDTMVAWTARKRSPLAGDEWNSVLISSDAKERIVNEVRFNLLSEWARAIVVETAPGESVLEIGSGTAEISLQMAQAGRIVTCLDSDPDSLGFAQLCADRLGLKIKTACCDATRPLPFDDDEFDCVWSSGLLEHFGRHDRRAMLSEWGRVCRGRMIHLVPNASCLAYRVGKAMQERQGVWPYGLEMPQVSLADDFRSAGYEVVREFSVAHRHAMDFLPPEARGLRKFLSRLWTGGSPAEVADWNQGYLLVTIGKKSR